MPGYQDKSGGGGNGPKMDDGFAITLAAMISMLASPALNEVTAPYVVWIAQRSYPPDWVEAIGFAWMVCCWPLTFFAARAGVAAALAVASMYAGYKFVPY